MLTAISHIMMIHFQIKFSLDNVGIHRCNFTEIKYKPNMEKYRGKSRKV